MSREPGYSSNTALSSPYKGLASYSEADASFFFGRESEWEVVADNLMATRLTLLYGASGVGKSSLLRAGVTHHLRQEAKDNLKSYGMPEFAVVIFNTWQDDPLASLANQIESDVKQLFANKTFDPLPSSLAFDEILKHWVARLHEDGSEGELFVILDQFEEYFLYHPNEGEGKTFFSEFPRAINCPDLPVNFLVSIREDSLAKLDRFKASIPNLFNNYLRVDHLDAKSAYDAVSKPIDVYNDSLSRQDPIVLDEGLTKVVIDQVSQVFRGSNGLGLSKESRAELEKQIEAPYLQLVMEYLWRQEVENNHSDSLRLQTLLDMGGAEKIVSNHLNRQMELLRQEEGEEALVAVAKIFQYLVTPSGSKIAYPLKDLAETTKWPVPRLRELLEKLASGQQRLLRATSRLSDAHSERYEIFHDVLAQPILDWRKQYLLDEEKNRHNLAIKEGLPAQALRQQKFMQYEKSVLLACQAYRFYQRGRNKVLYQIDEALRDGLSLPYFSNILRSRDKGLFGFAAVAFNPQNPNMLASADHNGVIRLWDLRHSTDDRQPQVLQEHHSDARALAFSPDGKTLASSGPNFSVYLWSNVDDAVSPGRIIGYHNSSVNSVAFSRYSPILASSSSDGTIKLWDLENSAEEEPVAILEGHKAGVKSIAFNPNVANSHLLASASKDQSVKIWDTRSNSCLKTLEQHSDMVRSIAFSSNGQVLASGSEDKTVILWDLSDFDHIEPLETLTKHRSGVRSVAFSADGKWLASGSEDQRLYLWRLHSPSTKEAGAKYFSTKSSSAKRVSLEKELRGHSYSVNAISFSPDNRLLASGSWDKTIRLWHLNPPEARSQTLIEHGDNVMSVAVSPDGQWLASGSWDKTVRLQALSQPDAEPEIIGEHDDRVLALAFGPSSRMLASASQDRTIKLWRNVQNREQRPEILRGHEDIVSSVAFSPDGRWLASGSRSEDATVRLWDLQYAGSNNALAPGQPPIPIGKVLWTHENEATHAPESVMSVAFSPDGQMLAAGGNDKTIKLLHLETTGASSWESLYARLSDRASEPSAARPMVLIGHNAGVWSVAFSPDSRMLASGSDDRTIRLWSLNQPSGQPKILNVLEEHSFWVGSVAFSPDGQTLASGSYDKTIRLWDLNHLSEDPILLRGHEQSVTSVAFYPNSKKLVSGSYDNTIRSWIVDTQTLADMVCQKVQRNLSQREWSWFMGADIPYEKTCPGLPPGEGTSEDGLQVKGIGELEQKFRIKLAQLLPRQNYFLKSIEQMTASQNDVSEEELAGLLDKPKGDEGTYYRLETLRLLGFLVVTDPGYGRGTIRYGLSPQYQEYLSKVDKL